MIIRCLEGTLENKAGTDYVQLVRLGLGMRVTFNNYSV